MIFANFLNYFLCLKIDLENLFENFFDKFWRVYSNFSLGAFWETNLIFRRTFIVIFSSISVFSSMAACTLPGFRNGTGGSVTTLGVLKRDPSVRQDGFGSIRQIKDQDCTESQCLAGLSGIKTLQTDDQTIYFLSKNKGLFRTSDGGRIWERLYFFPINNGAKTKVITSDKGEKSTVEKTPEELQAEVDQKIAQNDSFVASDFTIDMREPSRIYISGLFDKVGKIMQSLDSGATFREIYTEVDKAVSVKMVTIHPKSSQRVFGILDKGALVRSMDGGATWQKVRSFKEVPVQIGFVPEFDNLFFALFPTLGLATSLDDGETWQTQELTRQTSRIGEAQNRDKFEANPFANKEKFGTYEKVIPVVRGTRYLDNSQKETSQNTPQNNNFQIPFVNNSASSSPTQRVEQPWILIADRQVWFAGSPTDDFTKLVLPVQAEQYNILDAAPDPRVGLDKILVSVDNKIFETQNRGTSWSLKDKIQLSSPIGNIGQILIDKNNSEIIYLMLVDLKAKRGTGFML